MPSCQNCHTNFDITESDLKFYDKISPIIAGKKYPLPPPTLCPDCRQIRRLMATNEINLYRRKCSANGQEIISNIHPSSPHTVYNQEYWWGDKWDPLKYGKDFDFSRPFFEQFQELLRTVPQPSLFTGYQYDENCDYTNYAAKNKNCYFIFDADYCRDTYYSYSANHLTNCIDCYRVWQSELCYENVDCRSCYNSKYLQNSSNCIDSAFLDNCFSCKNCFMCFNLQRKEYWIYNRQSTKEEYEKLMAQLSSSANVEKFKNEFKELKMKHPQKYMQGLQNENVSGNHLYNCKNVRASFDCNDAWDCTYIYQSFGTAIKDSMDFDECGEFAELIYESSDCGYNISNLKFCANCLDQNSNLTYCNQCYFSGNLFGCVSLKRKKYCILNKQYSPEEYEKMVARIIEHMQKTGEFGGFFPPSLSLFAYNETLAMDFAPLTKEEALKKGYTWRDEDKQKISQTFQIPADIKDVPDSIIKEILACTSCGSNYKIIPQELQFYRERLIPIPTQCFKCRHIARLRSRNPRKLYRRTCAKCTAAVDTSYAPERKEKIYCEKCYLETVY